MLAHKIKKFRHATYLLHVHLVFVTKYRKKILGDLHLTAFNQYASEICGDFGAELKECDGEPDMLIEYAPIVQLSVLVNCKRLNSPT